MFFGVFLFTHDIFSLCRRFFLDGLALSVLPGNLLDLFLVSPRRPCLVADRTTACSALSTQRVLSRASGRPQRCPSSRGSGTGRSRESCLPSRAPRSPTSHLVSWTSCRRRSPPRFRNRPGRSSSRLVTSLGNHQSPHVLGDCKGCTSGGELDTPQLCGCVCCRTCCRCTFPRPRPGPPCHKECLLI